MRVGPCSEKRRIALAVFSGAVAEELDNFALRIRARDIEIASKPILRRDRGEQTIHRLDPDVAQHLFAV